jgi:hypothetical protein
VESQDAIRFTRETKKGGGMFLPGRDGARRRIFPAEVAF